jgi:prevent-host-death family protein
MPRATKLKVTEDIVPIGEFKTHASEFLRRMNDSGRPMVITQNGRPAAVVLTPEDFDELGYREFVKAKVRSGLESAKKKTHSAASVREHFRAKDRAR